MIIKYHGKSFEAINTLEDGEKELDLLEDNVNLEDTMEFSNNFLENTLNLNELKNIDMGSEEDDE